VIADTLYRIDAFVAGYAKNPRPADIPYWLDQIALCLELPNITDVAHFELEKRREAIEAVRQRPKGWPCSTAPEM